MNSWRKPVLILMAAVGLLSMGPAAWADDTAPGSIAGQVLNGTRDDRPVPRIEVTLFGISEQQLQDSQSAVTDENGEFTFQALGVQSQLSYALAVTYQGAKYFSDRIEAGQNASRDKLVLRVYETSADRSDLRVGNQHLYITVADCCLRIQEMLFMKNDSKHTFLPEAAVPLEISLPTGAGNVETGGLISGENSVVQDNLIRTFIPIPPAGEEIIFQYDLVLEDVLAEDGSYRLRRMVEYPTEALNVFLAVPGARMSSEELGEAERVTIEGVEYQHLAARDLPAGGSIALAIRLPSESGRGSPQRFLLLLTILASASILTLALLKNRRKLAADPVERQPEKLEQMIEEIARLDEEFAAGRLDEALYRGLREEKKTLLLSLSRNPRQMGSGLEAGE